MKEVYALTIINGDNIEFKCLISEDVEYFRVQIDELDYETMINQLLTDGYTSVKQVDTQTVLSDGYKYDKPIYEEIHAEFKTPKDIYEALLEDGFECQLESQTDFNDVLEFSVDGQDLGIEVITNTNKRKITTAANFLFKAANNEDYEPTEIEKSGSYNLVLSDSNSNSNLKENILHILNELKNATIDRDRYFLKDNYYAFITSFIEIASMRHLDILKLKVGEKEDEKISLTKANLLNIKQAVEIVQTSKAFVYNKTSDDRLTAFEINDKNEKKFKLHSDDGFDDGTMRICYVESEELYEKIQKHSKETIDFSGYYKSATRTVTIESASIIENKEA
ncbi:MAG: hypothetical protein U9P72_01405 [Campylobacterota bacterium]|nr:hypothetical protein [Campylobacterota bacterium]